MEAILSLLQDGYNQQHLLAFVYGSIRLSTFVGMVAFLGPQVSMAVKLPIMIALYLPLHPLMVFSVNNTPYNFLDWGNMSMFNTITMVIIIAKEVLLGYLLATFVNFIFYIAMTAGLIIDNQRGATNAQQSDPFLGDQSSPMGTIFFMSAINLFLSSGGLVAFLAFYYATYVAWPVCSLLPELLTYNFAVFGAQQASFLVTKAFIFAAPFVLAALLCDLSLGIMNRFAPQLNVYVLSMPVKSAICSFLVLLYLNPFFYEIGNLLSSIPLIIQEMVNLLTSS